MRPFCNISTFKILMHFYIEIKIHGFNISIVTHFILIIIHVHIFQIKKIMLAAKNKEKM